MSTETSVARRPKMTAEEATAFNGFSVANIVTVKNGLACGCEPYEDVFTYRRWQAQGQQVRRGAKAIKIPVVIVSETENDDGEIKTRHLLRTSAVFCRHQVDAR